MGIFEKIGNYFTNVGKKINKASNEIGYFVNTLPFMGNPLKAAYHASLSGKIEKTPSILKYISDLSINKINYFKKTLPRYSEYIKEATKLTTEYLKKQEIKLKERADNYVTEQTNAFKADVANAQSILGYLVEGQQVQVTPQANAMPSSNRTPENVNPKIEAATGGYTGDNAKI